MMMRWQQTDCCALKRLSTRRRCMDDTKTSSGAMMGLVECVGSLPKQFDCMLVNLCVVPSLVCEWGIVCLGRYRYKKIV